MVMGLCWPISPFTIHQSPVKIMDNFFAEFLGADSVFILLVALGGFLIGFLTAWLMWGGEAKRYKKEAEQWKKSHDDLLAQYKELKEELELKEADLVRAQREATEAIAIAKSLEADKDKWQKDLDTAIADSVKAQAAISSYRATVEDLNNQVIGLKAMNADLTEAMSNSHGDNANTEAAFAKLKELEDKLSELETEKAALVVAASNSTDLVALQSSHDEAAERMKVLESENKNLRARLEELESGINETPVGNDIFGAMPDKTDVDKGESMTLSAVAARDKVTVAIGKKIPAATAAQKDDLTQIKGIGSFLEKKLNALGIYTYEQVSQFDADMIENVTTAIEFFPGRIERDDWVGQAAVLLAAQGSAPKGRSVSDKKMSDLKTVEGIGPKIERLLKNHGIPDLPSLAMAKEERLREILSDAGRRYNIHDPATWPEQATLAVNGEWAKLEELQERLKGGREVE